jgi:hypothetical protein
VFADSAREYVSHSLAPPPAVLTFNLLSHRTRSDGTDAIVARWNATAVYRAMEGTWKSIHVHWSYIKPELKTPVSEEMS